MKRAKREVPTQCIEKCPACGSTATEIAVSEVKDWFFQANDQEWRFARCENCGSLYLAERPTEAALGEVYEGYYTHTSPETPAPISKPNLASIISNSLLNARFGTALAPSFPLPVPQNLLSKLVSSRLESRYRYFPKLKKGARILDVGCGSGQFIARANAAGWKGYGVDFDPKAVKAARQKGLRVQLGDIDVAEKFGIGFDMITFSHVIEHVPDIPSTLEKTRRLLAPAGALHLEYPNPKAPGFSTYGRFWRGLEAPRHLCLPSKCAMDDLLRKARFGKVSWIEGSNDEDRQATDKASESAVRRNGAKIPDNTSDNGQPTFLRAIAWL